MQSEFVEVQSPQKSNLEWKRLSLMNGLKGKIVYWMAKNKGIHEKNKQMGERKRGRAEGKVGRRDGGGKVDGRKEGKQVTTPI